jgi:galactokinase
MKGFKESLGAQMEVPSTQEQIAVYQTKRFSVLSAVARVFVPGRICLFGEHSDWCSAYSGVDGRALVVSTEQGLYASCRKVCDGRRCLRYISNEGQVHEIELTIDTLATRASLRDNYFAYVDGTAACFLRRYPWKSEDSILIDNFEMTLPQKKGLSSSAAVCVMVVRCFSIVTFGKSLSPEEEMELAFLGERQTPSLCGKLDQICAFMQDRQVALVRFRFNPSIQDVEVFVDEIIRPCRTVYLVLVCVPGQKDTVVILSALQSAGRNNEGFIRLLFGEWNASTVIRAADIIRSGESANALGVLAREAMGRFDQFAAPFCVSELTAPNLHALLADEEVKKYVIGGKSVGAGGDGTALLFCPSSTAQEPLIRYLTDIRGLDAWSISMGPHSDLQLNTYTS